MLGPHSGMGQRGGQEPCQGDMMQAAAGRADAVGQPGCLLCWHLLGPLLRGGGRPGQGGALPCIPLPSGPKAPPEPLPGLMGRGYTGTGRGLGGDPNLCSAARSQTWVPGNPLGPHRCARPVATNGQHSDPSLYTLPPPPKVSCSMPLYAPGVAMVGVGECLVRGDPCRTEWWCGQQIPGWRGPWVPGFSFQAPYTLQTPGLHSVPQPLPPQHTPISPAPSPSK